MKELQKLSKSELISCLENVFKCHEDHYMAVKSQAEDVTSGFFQLAGNIIAIRENYKLPELKSSK